MLAYWWSNDLVARGLSTKFQEGWHHVATTWDGTTRKIWVDQKVVAEKSFAGNPPSVIGTDNFCIGSTGGNEKFKGKMKNIRIWNSAKDFSNGILILIHFSSGRVSKS